MFLRKAENNATLYKFKWKYDYILAKLTTFLKQSCFKKSLTYGLLNINFKNNFILLVFSRIRDTETIQL